MEPLTKASLNNQIVTMRHTIRKSKVHTINKLSREAKKIKEKKGSEEHILKNKKKAERFINELMVIKKLNDDVVTKYALQNEEPSATVLNNVNIALETRAMARLAGHKFILDAVQNFRNEYPDWKLSLPELLNQLGAKYRAKKKPNQQKTINKIEKQIDSNLKNNTIIDDTTFKDTTESECHNNISNESNITIKEDKSNVEETKLISPIKIKNNINCENPNTDFVICNNEIITEEKNKNMNNCNISKELSHVLKTKTSEFDNIQSPENILNKLISESSGTNDKLDYKPLKRKIQSNVTNMVDCKKRNIIEEIKPVCETVDSFFMTADNKDYMSVYKIPPAVEKSLTECPKLDYQKPMKEIYAKGKKVTIGKTINKGNRRERRQQQLEEPVETVLHPSWEAKRKQKSLAKFEGKKITFDDQD